MTNPLQSISVQVSWSVAIKWYEMVSPYWVDCSKAKCILGLLYRSFYGWADCKTIIKLYLSVVRPHLEYASSLWDPHTTKDILALENVQKFARKIASKQWSSDYQRLLEACAIPSLAERIKVMSAVLAISCMVTVIFPKVFMCSLPIITLMSLDPIIWLLNNLLLIPILFCIH